ncbi:Calreticulin family protein [Histomonas meleagridis]|uniref:Calreticulin family protein n=1 Tax=Histomonas meleagridis TaxID=135588 RepID=UPI003559523E|nr:Calreticulin family protein [Histomonas meleagridis]KAH0797858.1 Calreticulin family protein [Histomonas meleagridis]
MSLITLLLFGLVLSDEEGQLPMRPEGNVFHFQSFNDPDWEKKWIITQLPNYTGQWKVEESKEPQSYPGEKMIFMKTAMAYYGLSTKFDTPLDLTDQTLVVQYELRLQETLECGGAYIKLFGKDNFEPTTLCNETRYVIMFGPDKCGSTNKVHFIFRHKNPKTGVVEEKHMTNAPSIKTDKNNHLYTLIVRPDNSFEILIDAESVKQGNLLTDFAPSVNPPKEIDDPTDVKPDDWVDEEMIPDPEAKKPDDWDEDEPEYIKDPEKLSPPEGWLVDEPKFIPDPEAQKPDDWDDDIHGEWEAPTVANPKCEAAPGCGEYEAPLIKNPNYKGKWHAPQIKNPAYKGVWKPRQIPNPDYFEDLHPHNFPTIIGAGFELWMVNKELGFNNILISTDEAVVHKWNKDHFTPKHTAQEEKTKKEEKKEKASEKAESFTGALTDFVSTIKDAWTNLYSENQIATVAITAIGGLIPVVLMIVICCRKPAPKAKPAAEKKPKAEEKKEEKKPKVEEVKEETKEAENKPESESESDSSSSSEDEKKEEEKPKVQKRNPKRKERKLDGF